MTVSLVKTPSDWLLEQFDANPHRTRLYDTRGSVTYARPMLQVIDDHAAVDCHPSIQTGLCRHMSGYASWPKPNPSDELRDEVLV